MTKTIEERIAYLQKCAELYETDGSSPLTDVEYDKEYDECKKIKPTDKFFLTVGGIDFEHLYGTPFTHKYMMGSLNKSKTPEEFAEWFVKTHSKHDLIALLDLKVDGLSLCIHYKGGNLVRVVTRGDGTTGIDVTPNAKYIEGVLPTINVEGEVEVKGECYKNRQDFYKNWANRLIRGKYPANPRNFAAGAVNQKDPNVTKERGLSFVSYDVRGMDFDTETNKVKFLEENGFDTLHNYTSSIKCEKSTAKEIEGIIKTYMDGVSDNREDLPFDIDGVVFKVDDLALAGMMGFTDSEGRRPKSNRAIKFPAEQKETILEDIEWSIGRTGALTPVGLLKPVSLAGTTVQRVTLHNLKEMSRLGIKNYGCTVVVEKAGDIIPKVIRKTKDGDDSNKIYIPELCPACESTLEWDSTDTTKWCKNEFCLSQINGNIENWFKKIGVKGIGEGIINRLTNDEKNSFMDPMVSCISDMYNLEHYKSELRESFGPKALENILASIDSVKDITLAKFIEALGIGKIGTMAKELTAIAPTIEDIDNLTISDIVKIDGFAETKATSFIEGWSSNRDEISKILQYISITEKKLDSQKLEGQKYCFTGSFSNPSRKEMEKMVEDNGGKKSSVSKNLNALVWDESISGGKVDKAKKLGIPIISQKEFLEKLS